MYSEEALFTHKNVFIRKYLQSCPSVHLRNGWGRVVVEYRDAWSFPGAIKEFSILKQIVSMRE